MSVPEHAGAPPDAEAPDGGDPQEALMQFLYQAPIGLVRTTLDGSITMINPMAAQLLMPLAAQRGGPGQLANLFDLLEARAPQLRRQAAAAPWPAGTVCDGLRLHLDQPRRPDGTSPTLSLQLLRMDAGTLMGSLSDVSDAVQREQQHVAARVRDASRTDSLTALPNRTVVLESIERAIRRARDDRAGRFLVLFVNGDRFNRVNVTLGPAAGDELLRLMGARIAGALRHRDTIDRPLEPGEIAARLGVDEFVVVVERVPAAGAGAVAESVAHRLVEALSQPYMIGSQAVHSTASIGVVLGDAAASDAEAVLQDASLAMREAKRAGGARHCLFEPSMKELARGRAKVESELRIALQQDQLFVVFQPIRRFDGGGVAGVEALVRWRHPERGLVPPVEFIGVAEESGLIAPLGIFVLNAACRQFARWDAELGERAPGVLSVNLSRAQLGQPTLVADVRLALESSGLAPGRLQLEITESLAAENPLIQSRLHDLKRLGVQLALDDFGTGYSSLANLHLWPVDVIKIDRSFVSQVASSTHHRVLVEATVRVARSLGMRTVAEGVETAEQASVLKALRCDKGQGYLYSKPLDGEAATRWLAEQPPAAPRSVEGRGPDRAETAERLLQQLERSANPVALFDPKERMVWCNDSFREVYWRHEGLPTWEQMMRTAHQRREGVLIDTEDIDAWIDGVRQRYRRQPRRVFESDMTDGRWMRVSEETDPEGWQLSLCSDVTSLKVHEDELRRAHDAALAASITDPLTGLPNRRHVFARLATLMTQAGEMRLPLTVAVIDLDHFKQINDRHGHAVGDSVLTAFAERLVGTLRPHDVLGRIGGEEFLLVLMNTDRSGAERVLRDARRALRTGTLVPQVPTLRPDFSAGATVAHPGDTSDTLVERADRGLYAAKAAGRGRDVFVETPAQAPGWVQQRRRQAG